MRENTINVERAFYLRNSSINDEIKNKTAEREKERENDEQTEKV